MSKFKQREIIMVMGRTGTGKSIWTRKFMKAKKRVFAFDPLLDFNADYISDEQLVKQHDKDKFITPEKFRVGISDPDDINIMASIALISGDNWLMIEEAGFLFQSGSRAPEWMRDAAFLGRHQKLNVLITAQRPTSIPVDLRSQATRVICFRQKEQRDMNWLSEYFGERYDEVTKLAPLECLDAEGEKVDRYRIDWQQDDKNIIV